jgi:Cu(I)/Ag(I) efflux system membrane protein CusA/SilA
MMLESFEHRSAEVALANIAASSESMQRIAVPMIGGMISSTLLTLIVIPAIYALVKGAGLGKVSVTKAEPGQAGASVI